jgi:UDP-arabinose 4-epimerase
MQAPRVLVTGGAGYIGSHTSKALKAAGFLPVALDNLVYGSRRAVQWGPLVEANFWDGAALQRIFDDYAPAAVVHFAAYAYVGESVIHPDKYYDNNVVGTIRMLDRLKTLGRPPIIFSSSCATYGIPTTLPITEDHPQRPINPYGNSKAMVERIIADYGHAYGFRHAVLRYFNAAGADADGDIGEDHEPETHLVPLVIQAALGQRAGIDVYGTDYPTVDGTAVRDYTHVSDLASAHVLSVQHLLSGGPSLTVNLGSGKGHTVRQVIAAVEKESGLKVPARFAPRRPGDPAALFADISHAADVLGWKPVASELPHIVRTALEWHRAHVAVS